MKKILGIFGLLLAICIFTTLRNGQFVSANNVENVIRWTALFGIISIGVAFVIITGGIDLSIGSVIALTGCLLPMFLTPTFTPTDQQFVVAAVDSKTRTVTLEGEPPPFGKDDQLLFRSGSNSTQRHLTVKLAAKENGQTTVEVREFVSYLKPKMSVQIAHQTHMNVPLAVLLVLLISLGIGLTHGLLITKLRLPPFVVTLCGLLVYRGLARKIANDQIQGFGTSFESLKYLAQGRPFSIPVPFLKWISEGNWSPWKHDLVTGEAVLDSAGQPISVDWLEWIAIPTPVVMVIVIAVIAGVFLNYSIYGRYLLALGRNEQAARYSGINTDRMVILSYLICSLLAGVAGILFALDLNSVQPASHANFYELYAIAAAVLGGCSLRGGEGSIIGVLIGAAVMRVLYNSINLTGIPPQLEFVIIGMVILIGVIADELVKRLAAQRRAVAEAKQT